jgi:hypothetical protein
MCPLKKKMLKNKNQRSPSSVPSKKFQRNPSWVPSESVVNKLQRNPSSLSSKRSVVQNFRRRPWRVPKQIKKCQTKGFKSYFIPYFASLVPSFGISPPVMGSLQRSGNTGDEAKGGDGRGNSEPAATSTPRRMDGKWWGNCFSVGSVAFVLLPTY